MNRGGLAGATFELDDRFTGYDVDSIAMFGYDGGKMLLRVDLDDDRTAPTLEACARAVSGLADAGLIAMVEPFLSRRGEDGRLRNDLSVEAATTALTVAAALGHTSAYTWLKVPVIGDGGDDMARVLGATTLPTLLLGGEVAADADATYARWAKALRLPTVRGLVVGRSLLYPPDGDVAGAVDTAAGLLDDRLLPTGRLDLRRPAPRDGHARARPAGCTPGCAWWPCRRRRRTRCSPRSRRCSCCRCPAGAWWWRSTGRRSSCWVVRTCSRAPRTSCTCRARRRPS